MILPSVEKRYASIVYCMRTYFMRSIHQISVHCDFIRVKVLNCTKPSERINFLLFAMSICNTYEQQTVLVCYHYYLIYLNVCGILSASSWPSLNSHSLSLKDKVHGCLYIVSSTDIERCERMHLVIVVCIPCVYVRIYAIHPLHPLSIRCFRYASALKLSPITPSELSSSSIRVHPSSFQYSYV